MDTALGQHHCEFLTSRVEVVGCTWTAKVCRVIAFWAALWHLGHHFFHFWGVRKFMWNPEFEPKLWELDVGFGAHIHARR